MLDKMEFGPGDPVWLLVPDSGPTPFYVPGRVLEFHKQGNVLTVQEEDRPDGPGALHTFELPSAAIKKRLDDDTDGVEDMVQLADLCEPALLWNIKRRYESGLIYTYIGSILISVNPYRMSDTLYGQAVVKEYEGRVLGTLPPHLFAIGSSAYANMMKDHAGQVVVISGESGSGKTESTKLILGYLALVNKCPSNLITEQILEASPLLESFGNAKTVKNDNSSRFGKYVQLYYSENGGSITGARITEYLLEKSRICTQSPEERNYHVFYEMLKGLSREQKETYGLTSAEKYFYLNQGAGGRVQTSKNDSEDYKALMSALQILGFGAEDVDVILRILAAVLHLGNVYFHRKALKHGQEGVEIGSEAEIAWIGHLLQISVDGIKKALTTRITEAGGARPRGHERERIATPLTIDQSLDSRDAIAKVLYSSLFTWLVSRVNRIVFKGETRLTLSVLDIFGFEDLAADGGNSFEQLCINYANESLQHYHNKYIFKQEQAEYAREKIDWAPIAFVDNGPVLHLLAKKPVGLLHLLDDESNFPKGTDASFLEKAHYNHALSPHYARPRLSAPSFTVKHYAGSVTYHVAGFLEKNRDTLRLDVARLLATSAHATVARIFQQHHSIQRGAQAAAVANGRGHGSRGGVHAPTVKPRAPTIAARFHDSLQQLLANMSRQSPWFVRCLKPNTLKQAENFDPALVLEQIRYSGLLETVRIRRHGYAVRLDYNIFARRFSALAPREFLHSLSARDATRLILSKHNDFQLGLSKVFLREALHQRLEAELYALHERAAIRLQQAVRGYLQRRSYARLRRATVLIQSLARMRRERKQYVTLRSGALVLQRSWRARRARRHQAQARRRLQDSSGCALPLNHLEIPPALAHTFKRLDSLPPSSSEFVKVTQVQPSGMAYDARAQELPAHGAHTVPRFQREIKKILGMKREPISVPFLPNSDTAESQALFKLVLRYMNTPASALSDARAAAIVSYMARGPHEDEAIVQCMNQCIGNQNAENRERGLSLLVNLLSVVRPSTWLLRYVSNFVEELVGAPFAPLMHAKLLQSYGAGAQQVPQRCALSLLEARCNKSTRGCAMALPIAYIDGVAESFELHSWTTVAELAQAAAARRFAHELNGAHGLGAGAGGVPPLLSGWNLELDENELESGAYVLDVVGALEGCAPGASTGVGFLFGGAPGLRAREELRSGPEDDDIQPLKRAGMANGHAAARARSLDDLSSSGYGLSPSKLNDRYRASSQEQLLDLDDEEDDGASSVGGSSNEELYPVMRGGGEDGHAPQRGHGAQALVIAEQTPGHRSGHPRFIKSKRSGAGGSSLYSGSRDVKSSAMSDTSEAPSLASHVRRVRVPSVGSDVEQFLDDLFSPVLGLDDMSDVRSLSSRIKGGGAGPVGATAPFFSPNLPQGNAPVNPAAFLQSAMQQNVQIQQQLIQQNNALQALLAASANGSGAGRAPQGGSTKPPPPPPLPAELIDQGSRPFVDPYGRAKTVRIGKWRWPPCPAQPGSGGGADNFSDFKARQEEKSKIDGGAPAPAAAAVHVAPFKIARPFGGELVGKLKISSEMREKLEMVTSSVRGANSGVKKRAGLDEEIIIKKIGDDRKMALAEKLGGGGVGVGVGSASLASAPPPPPPPAAVRPLATMQLDGMGPRAFGNGAPPPPPQGRPLTNGSNALAVSTGVGAVAPSGPHYTYARLPYVFRLRKEVFAPGETLQSPLVVSLIFQQVIRDVFASHVRILPAEGARMRTFLQENQIVPGGPLHSVKPGLKRHVIELSRGWALYFAKIWRVESTTEVKYIAVNGAGLSLVRRVQGQRAALQVLDQLPFARLSSVYVDESGGKIQISCTNGQRLHFYSKKGDADSVEQWIGLFMKAEAAAAAGAGMGDVTGMGSSPVQATPVPPPPNSQPPVTGDNGSRSSSPSYEHGDHGLIAQGHAEGEGHGGPGGDGKHSLIQFAIDHFRRDKFKLGEAGAGNGGSWTWSEQMQLVKYSPAPLDTSLLPLDEGNNLKALENYASIMRYMGDLPLPSHAHGEVEAVYTLLRNCHTSPPLRDELYCQMMKQTTNNSQTAQRGWRLFTILSAYFTCSDELRPYLFKYLESTAYDKRRPYHGTALVTLQNLRKTFKYGGRRNVPSVEEITAITAGRNAKRQIFRLPGGTQRVLNVKMSTVVRDVIEEMCGLLNITSSEEREEFSIYCIVEGDTFTMPLMKEEYILDVTTELYKNQQVFYLIFCRSVWSFPLRFDSESYIEVAFNQVAPDYLEGLLLVMPGGTMKQNDVHDIARIAALLHAAASLSTQPTLKETKYLLPKPALAARDLKPNQWVHLVHTYWSQVKNLNAAQAKAAVLQTLQGWSLFGSSFFSVRRITNESPGDEEYILALNKNGVHFLDVVTHEPVTSAPYSEIISTRKVKNEDGVLYLDIKFGNLLQQRISRIQTEHAHEISRLIRMYISIQQKIIQQSHLQAQGNGHSNGNGHGHPQMGEP